MGFPKANTRNCQCREWWWHWIFNRIYYKISYIYYRSNDARYTCHLSSNFELAMGKKQYFIWLWQTRGVLLLTYKMQKRTQNPHKSRTKYIYSFAVWLRREIFAWHQKTNNLTRHLCVVNGIVYYGARYLYAWELWAISFIFFAGLCHFLFFLKSIFLTFSFVLNSLNVCVQWQR